MAAGEGRWSRAVEDYSAGCSLNRGEVEESEREVAALQGAGGVHAYNVKHNLQIVGVVRGVGFRGCAREVGRSGEGGEVLDL